MHTCPICEAPLGADDELVAEFSAEHGWWVLRHYKRSTTLYTGQNGRDDIDRIALRKGWCGMALQSVRGTRAFA